MWNRRCFNTWGASSSGTYGEAWDDMHAFWGKLCSVCMCSSARMLFGMRIKSHLEYLTVVKRVRMNQLFWSSMASGKKIIIKGKIYFSGYSYCTQSTFISFVFLFLFSFWWTCFLIPFYELPRVLSNFSKVIISSFRQKIQSYYSIQDYVKTAL